MAQKSAAQKYRKRTTHNSGKRRGSYGYGQDRVFRHSPSTEEIFRIQRRGSISCRRF